MTPNETNEPPDEEYVEHEEEAAAEEAAAIGGERPDYHGRRGGPRHCEEGGGGVAEGFEGSEEELIEAASHGEHRHSPLDDEFTPEVASDESGAVYGEPDEIDPTEVVQRP